MFYQDDTLLENHDTNTAAPMEQQQGEEMSLLHRLPSLAATIYRQPTPLGTAFITISETPEGQPFEVFMTVGKAGSERAAAAEALGRLISFTLRLQTLGTARERLERIADQLSDIGGGRPLGFGAARINSLPDAIAQVIKEHLGEKAPCVDNPQVSLSTPGDYCPECGESTLVSEEGCRKCHLCGYSDC